MNYGAGMRFDKRREEWSGVTTDGRRVHVGKALWEHLYRSRLAMKHRATRERKLFEMTRADYWVPHAEREEATWGGKNPELYIDDVQTPESPISTVP